MTPDLPTSKLEQTGIPHRGIAPASLHDMMLAAQDEQDGPEQVMGTQPDPGPLPAE